jgi:hypothetical protein
MSHTANEGTTVGRNEVDVLKEKKVRKEGEDGLFITDECLRDGGQSSRASLSRPRTMRNTPPNLNCNHVFCLGVPFYALRTFIQCDIGLIYVHLPGMYSRLRASAKHNSPSNDLDLADDCDKLKKACKACQFAVPTVILLFLVPLIQSR